jgi:hypothetical protein
VTLIPDITVTWRHLLRILDGYTPDVTHGQVLNALIVFAAPLFTKSLVKNRLAALLAALLRSVYTDAAYTSWGRYNSWLAC